MLTIHSKFPQMKVSAHMYITKQLLGGLRTMEPMLDSTEASTYYPNSPVSHAGQNTFVHARARAPIHLGLLGPQRYPSGTIGCSKDNTV